MKAISVAMSGDGEPEDGTAGTEAINEAAAGRTEQQAARGGRGEHKTRGRERASGESREQHERHRCHRVGDPEGQKRCGQPGNAW
jgi:hypothetical protein